MNLNDFEYLVALDDYRSVGKAARALFMSQPALSKFIVRIEKEMGTELFIRIGKGIVPTFAGEYCVEKSREILQLSRQIDNQIDQIKHLESGRIKIGVSLNRAQYFMSEIVPVFNQAYPCIQLIIDDGLPNDLIKKVRSGELDFIYGNHSETFNDLIFDKIASEEMVLVSPNCFNLDSKSFRLEGCQYPCILPEFWKDLPYIHLTAGRLTSRFVDVYISKHKLKPNILFKVPSYELAICAIRQGLGITITIASPNGVENENFSYYSLLTDSGAERVDTSIIYRTDHTLTAAEKKMIDIIKTTYRQQT